MPTSTASVVGDDRDHLLHETILLSTKQIVASIEASNARVEASSAGIQALLCQIVESQAQNQLQMMEMLKVLANSDNKRNINTSISNEEAAGNHQIDIPNEQIRPTVPSVGNDTEEVAENESSEINEQQEVNQVNPETNEFNYDGYLPMMEAIFASDWKKAKEYLHDHQTIIKDIFLTRDSRKEINLILLSAHYDHQYTFLDKFLELVPPETLEYMNSNGDTILHFAAISGGIKIVKSLVEKHPNLTQIRSNNELSVVPLVMAVTSDRDGQKEVIEYLYNVTRDEDPSPFSGQHGILLLDSLISADMYGIALFICQRFPGLAKDLMDADGENGLPGILKSIVGRPFAFLSGSKMKGWERCIYKIIEVDMSSPFDGEKQKVSLESTTKEDEENPYDASKISSLGEQCSITKCISYHFRLYIRRVPIIKKLYEQKLMHQQVVALTRYFLALLGAKATDVKSATDIFLESKLLEMAMKLGTTEFVMECLLIFPFLCVKIDDGELGHILIKLVVHERNEIIYRFIHILKHRRSLDIFSALDDNDNSILHYSAELPHNRGLSDISGAAFQMQREIQWFKMVENTMMQRDRFVRNQDGNTAHFLFTENHKDLMENGEKWMKDMSTSCMVVAALISTVAFAAAITVPGGNISDDSSKKNGLPIFLNKDLFMVFAIADASALVSSITSVLMFLAVFTSRYSEEDFLKSLPQKLIIGLATLFVSMASILVSFGAAFIIILGQQFHWTSIAISLFSCVPVLLFGFLQFPLFVEMVSSTYWPPILRKQDHRMFETYFPNEDWKVLLERSDWRY
ncbi:hypothetical protein C5167_007693 [Papaver somniferum]|uniref:uncharacterized protein LOC113344702 isoform X1 n=1 Tax=Papaver somniferum TaxID=3469 RepID=UPI000E6FBB0C|nr:uncharacterized protein LOC113344702 isoform X1 [Papaver somniferum]RZC93657.1 hypothetical protein C5167_007693 [Papaver somniferum]